ncbi:MAG: response regulator transcription factor [Chloroflexi bacterium]|nr:response regulator transcription factor [Chloroflexota bacterium]
MEPAVQKRVLVAGADPIQVGRMGIALEEQGYVVGTATSSRQGLQRLFQLPFHLAIIDVSTVNAQWDGWELCRRVREVSEMPILLLTSSTLREDVVRGLRLGADDCLAGAFQPPELLARVAALLRRTTAPSFERRLTLYANEDLWVDLFGRQVMVRGKPVRLTGREYNLLECLIRHAGQILSPQQLLDQVWDSSRTGAKVGVLKQYIWRLRRKIEKDPRQPHYILTERDFGYRFAGGKP